jgi:hypothetical protein
MDPYDKWKLATPEEDGFPQGECKYCGRHCNEDKEYCSNKCYNNDLND